MMIPAEQVRAYFLGEVPEEAAARIEIGVMRDADFAERAAEVEAELIDGYVDGELSPADRGRFEANYMTTPARRDRVRVALDLARKADRAVVPAPQAQSSPLWMLLPTAAVLLVGAFLFLAGQRPSGPDIARASPSPVRSVPTPIPAIASTSPAPTPKPPIVVLALAMVRGPSAPSFRVPETASSMSIEIDLEGETRFAIFDLTLRDDGGVELWKSLGSGSVIVRDDGVLVANVPTPRNRGRSTSLTVEVFGRTRQGRRSLVAAIPFQIEAR
jgi:hypothetical protein